METWKNVLILVSLVILLSVSLPSVNAADISKEWVCGSGMTCITDSCGKYKNIVNRDYSFTFSATPGIYSCEIEVKNCCYGFTGTTPQLNEYSDIYLNNERVGSTDDLFCNSAVPVDPVDPGEPCTSFACPYGCYDVNAGKYDGDSVTVQGGEGGGYCDDDPNTVGGLGNSAIITIDMTGCASDGYVFIKRNKVGSVHLPRCQTWDWTDRDCPGDLDGDEIVHIESCTNGAKNIFVGAGSYTVGSWTGIGGSRIKYCVTSGTSVPGTGPSCSNGGDDCIGCTGMCCDGMCCDGFCCDGKCYTGPMSCCYMDDCSNEQECINHKCTDVNLENSIPGVIIHLIVIFVSIISIASLLVWRTGLGKGLKNNLIRLHVRRLYTGSVGKLFLIMIISITISLSLVFSYVSAAGCTYCGDISKTIYAGQVELESSNTIKVRAYDAHGLKMVSIRCNMLQPPVANAGPDGSAEIIGTSALATFSGMGSNDPDGYIAEYDWDFDDGLYGYGISTTHNYYDEGYYTVGLEVTDNDGLKDSDTMELKVIERPVVTDGYAYDGVWVESDQTITLSASDSSGIDSVRYCIGAGCDVAAGQLITGPPYTIDFNQDMDELVMYTAWDTYDNPSELGVIDMKIDKTAPITTDNHDGEVHANGYIVTLDCDDGQGSGCEETRYCVSGNGSGTCSPAATGSSVIVTCDSFSYCERVISYYSIDNIGNQELKKTSSTIKIDTRIPTCKITELPDYTTSTDVSLSWSGKDSGGSGSGVTGYMIWYRDNSGSWAVWQDVFPDTTTSGTFTGVDGHTYDFRCQARDDLSGWGSHSTPVSTYIDTTSPTASFVTIPEWTGQNPFTLSWSGSDSGSGMKDYDVDYGTDGQGWDAWLTDTTSTGEDFGNGNPVSLSDGDTYYFRMRGTDNAGLSSDWTDSQMVGIDFTLPACSIDDLDEYIKASQLTLSWSGSDTGSGIKNYDVDYSDDGDTWTSFQNQTSDTSKAAGLMDGEYHFRCRARDNADNMGDWSASEVTKVDTRAPGANVEYNSPVLIGEEVKVNVSLYDVSDITDAVLVYDDEEITEDEKTETDTNDWEVMWTLTASDYYGTDEFFVVTEDMHGNSRSHRFSFSTVMCDDGDTQECGTDEGECEEGTRTCVSGVWGDCLGDLEKRLEMCDGKDNDCDGEIDDGIDCDCVPGTTQECGTDEGECIKGTQACTESREWEPCEDGYTGPVVEICDGKDNDCNGEIDNGAGCCREGTQRPCGFSNVGICELGISACMNGVWGDCKRAAMPEPNEICGNDLDDDCDGDMDEGCGLCTNGVQDDEEDGVDCGGSCPLCGEFPWFILSIIGAVILIVALVMWWFMKSTGKELDWDTLKGKWS